VTAGEQGGLVSAEAAPVLGLDDRRERLREAAGRWGALASHEDAAQLWGMELVRLPSRLQLTVPRCRSRCLCPAVDVHRSDVPAGQRAVVDGIAATSPERTVLDLARSLPLPEAVAAADSALRSKATTYEALVLAVAALGPARGRPTCRGMLARVDPCSRSVLESLCRVLLEEAGLRPFETQHVVRTASGTVGRVDFAWPQERLVVEVDGFAFHADCSSFRSDRRRTNAFVLGGWRVLRFVWEDVVHRPEVVVAQVRRALDG
jgi:very-short-patch-repair endonuclease